MQVLCVAEEQDGVLASEDRTQQGKGLGGTTEVGGNGLALHYGVGGQLKPKVREKTLQSLEYTLCHIYLEDHKVKRYEMQEEERVMAAEPDVEKK